MLVLLCGAAHTHAQTVTHTCTCTDNHTHTHTCACTCHTHTCHTHTHRTITLILQPILVASLSCWTNFCEREPWCVQQCNSNEACFASFISLYHNSTTPITAGREYSCLPAGPDECLNTRLGVLLFNSACLIKLISKFSVIATDKMHV